MHLNNLYCFCKYTKTFQNCDLIYVHTFKKNQYLINNKFKYGWMFRNSIKVPVELYFS